MQSVFWSLQSATTSTTQRRSLLASGARQPNANLSTDAPAFIRTLREGNRPVHLVLAKDLRRTILSGHPWLYSDAFMEVPKGHPPGTLALVKTKTGDILSKGLMDPTSPLAFRSLATGKEQLTDALIAMRLERALQLRERLFPNPQVTNGFRLLNGEGDGLPGLTCDIYDSVAVIKLDGSGPAGFYNEEVLANWLMERFEGSLRSVYYKYQAGGKSEERGKLLRGAPVVRGKPVVFLENGNSFQSDVVAGQKTGFFLDQRDNRARIGRLCAPSRSLPAGPTVLNLFGYTGGFSIYAGRAGAKHVTTVDIASAAVESAKENWALNGLQPGNHEAKEADAFAFLDQAKKEGRTWDVVVVDPPSFAPSQDSVTKALSSYTNLFTLAAQVTSPNGLLACASCSSHVTESSFSEVCTTAIGQARRKGYAICIANQPEDHPVPAAAPELRYLKFNVYQLEG